MQEFILPSCFVGGTLTFYSYKNLCIGQLQVVVAFHYRHNDMQGVQ